jgi:TRAP-type C4-dicarboxylate transport system permease small subunit
MEMTTASPVRHVTGVRKLIYTVCQWFEYVGLVAMFGMLVVTLIDVVGTKLMTKPLPGATEIIPFLQLTAIAGGLAYSKIDGRHIIVDFFVVFIPKRPRASLEVLTSLMGLGFFIILAIMSYNYGWKLYHSHTIAFTSKLPYYPFAFWITVCCIPMITVILMEIADSFIKAVKK